MIEVRLEPGMRLHLHLLRRHHGRLLLLRLNVDGVHPIASSGARPARGVGPLLVRAVSDEMLLGVAVVASEFASLAAAALLLLFTAA